MEHNERNTKIHHNPLRLKIPWSLNCLFGELRKIYHQFPISLRMVSSWHHKRIPCWSPQVSQRHDLSSASRQDGTVRNWMDRAHMSPRSSTQSRTQRDSRLGETQKKVLRIDKPRTCVSLKVHKLLQLVAGCIKDRRSIYQIRSLAFDWEQPTRFTDGYPLLIKRENPWTFPVNGGW